MEPAVHLWAWLSSSLVTRELESLLFLVDGGFLLAWHRILPPRDSEQKDNSAAHLDREEESKTSAESLSAIINHLDELFSGAHLKEKLLQLVSS